MTQKFNLSEQGPDPELGGLLRAHLEGLAPEQFVHRVIAGLPQRFTQDSWDVLARWARPGIAAAAIITAALGAWLAFPRQNDPVGEPLLELSTAADSELILSALIPEP
ncbi:MAG TPA: hypothetical protein VH438_16780 [Gemmatimonadales bacterium]